MQRFEEFEVLNRGFSICIGVVTSIARRQSAGSAARYSVAVNAGMGQVYHDGFCRGNGIVRIQVAWIRFAPDILTTKYLELTPSRAP
jgi:hypothetical protein